MRSGTVQTACLTPEEARAIAKATGAELVHKLVPIIQRIAGQLAAQLTGSARQDEVSIELVEGFLATVKGKNVPQDEWPQIFAELTRQYVTAGVRIESIPVTSERIKDLVDSADAARKRGRIGDLPRPTGC
jgi:hypothetical protein